MPSAAIGDNSLERKERYDIMTDEECYILVKVWDEVVVVNT